MVVLKSHEEIGRMRAAGRVVAEVLAELDGIVRPGVTTAELDRAAERGLRRRGGVPAFKGYRGYPASICASVNHEVVHGIPSDERMLAEGDIVGIDLGVVLDGFCGDAARTYAVGRVSDEALRLLSATERSLAAAVGRAVPGGHVGDIGSAVQATVEPEGFSVVRDFVGHGIGREMHEEPQVPNYGRAGAGMRLRSGMVLAIEPMINAGDWRVRVLPDGWTVETADGSLSAHFEHTVAVTERGPEILSVV